MRGPRRYFLYIAQRTLVGVFGLLAVIWMLVVSVDLIEAMREVGKVPGAGFSEAIRMTLFRTPQIILTVSPFVFLFGTLWAFGQMAKSSEIAVMRAAGLSVWRLVAAPVAVAVVCGAITVAVLDPIAASLDSRAQMIKNDMRGKSSNMVRAFRDGVWLRQEDQAGHTMIIRADRYFPEEGELTNVMVWRYGGDGTFVERWDAATADVTPDAFHLKRARRTTLEGANDGMLTEVPLPVAIDLRTLREDRAKPSSLSVWQIPSFIDIMGRAGMSTLEYEIRFFDLLALPLKLAAMVLIAAAVALGMNSRAGGTAGLMGIGIAAGFILFIFTELSSAVATAQIVPVALATWAPSILAVLAATTLLLYREDG